jgi:hypothetical protein
MRNKKIIQNAKVKSQNCKSKVNPPAGGFVRMTATISVILNLIQNQPDPDFRQDDSYGDDSVRQLAD